MYTLIQTPTAKIASSTAYYKQLGFNLVTEDNRRYAISKNLCIEINEDKFARVGVKFLSKSWDGFRIENSQLTITETDSGLLTVSPAGCCVYLEKNNAIADLDTAELKAPIVGTFSGLSIETNDFAASIAFWSLFGFNKIGGNEDYGWVSLEHENGFSIGLMQYNCCPHLFFNPSLSFFNGKENMAIIEKVRALNIPITEEITHFNKENIVDNIIIKDDGGLGYFLFND